MAVVGGAVDLPCQRCGHITQTINLTEDRIIDPRQIGQVDVAGWQIGRTLSFDGSSEVAVTVCGKAQIRCVHQVDALGVDTTVGDAKSLLAVNGVRSEVGLARCTGDVQEIVAWSLDVFIEVVDEPNVSQRLIT